MTWKIDTSEKEVFLTFDDGPHPEITPWVMEKLQEFEASGTFFCIGDNVEKHPETFESLKSNFRIGNHTFNHLKGWKTPVDEYLTNVDLCQKKVGSDVKLFRPPYGRITRPQAKALSPDFQIIMWTLLSGDFDKKLNAQRVAKSMTEKTEPGSIIVFHDSEKAFSNLKMILPEYLERLCELGFNLKPIP